MTNDLYGHNSGNRWVEIDDADVVSEEEMLYLTIDCNGRLEIRNIIESIDLNVADGVIFRYFILLNTSPKNHEWFDWVVVSEKMVYSDSEKRHEEEPKWSNTDDNHFDAFLNAVNGEH